MHITLISPPGWFRLSEFASALVPPLGLAYCAATLEKAGHEVTLLDAQAEKPMLFTRTGRSYLRGLPPAALTSAIPANTDLVGISFPYSFMSPLMNRMVNEIRTRFKHLPIILGGTHPTALPALTLRVFDVDLVVRGEGEDVLPHVCSVIGEPRWRDKLQECEGVAFMNNGEIHINGSLVIVKNLGDLPLPARHKLPMKVYQQVGQPHGAPRGIWTTMVASRGCPYTCSFCPSPFLSNQRWRIRSVPSVLDEMKTLNTTYGTTDFHFEDDNLTINTQWIKEFCDRLILWGTPFTWQINVGVSTSHLTDKLIADMAQAGLTNITFAPESGSRRVLKDIMGKDNSLKKIGDCVTASRNNSVRSCVFFILGSPGERRHDLKASRNYALELARRGADEVSMSLFTPLPGSRLFEELYPEPRFSADDDFFDHLADQSDLSGGFSWNGSLSSTSLSRFRKISMLLFYLQSFLCYPTKLKSLVKNIIKNTCETKTERIIRGKINFLRNRKLVK